MLALIGQGVSEKKRFENGHVHVYSPRGRGRQPPGVNYLSLHKLFSQFSTLLQVFPIIKDFVTVFTIETYSRPNLTLL